MKTISILFVLVLTIAACSTFKKAEKTKERETESFTCSARDPASSSSCRQLFATSFKQMPQQILLDLRNSRVALIYKSMSLTKTRGMVATTLSNYNHEYAGWMWTRDSALVVREIFRSLEYTNFSTKEQAINIWQKVSDYVNFSLATIRNLGSSNRGEPRADKDANYYKGLWARPQNDGPALRARTLIEVANKLLDTPNSGFGSLLSRLYKAESPNKITTLIKGDLEYSAQHWKEKASDIWEEHIGYNFYTMLSQRKALLDGARLARRMKDPAAAEHYEKIANEISNFMDIYWAPEHNAIIISRQDAEWRIKNATGIDIAVILAVLHSGDMAHSFNVLDSRIQATALTLENTFKPLYAINQVTVDKNGQPMAPALGRYWEDPYNGHPIEEQRFTGGHPWVLATLGMGEYYFEIAKTLSSQKFIEIDSRNIKFYQNIAPANTQVKLGQIDNSNPLFKILQNAAFEKGLQYWNRVEFHLGSVRTYSEMLNRDSGAPESIPDLTWSNTAYVSMLTAFEKARQAMGIVPQ